LAGRWPAPRDYFSPVRAITAACAVNLLGTACHRGARDAADLVPAQLVSGQSIIPYPADLYAQRVEGEVMLYLVVDSTGVVIRDSTRVVTSSGRAAFDSAALEAAPTLRFNPARRASVPVSAPIQLPIRFTLPDSVKPASVRP
jgi:TonB family protein